MVRKPLVNEPRRNLTKFGELSLDTAEFIKNPGIYIHVYKGRCRQ